MKNSKALAYSMIVCRSLIYGSSIFFTGALLASTDWLDVLALRFLISAVAFLVLALTKVIRINFRGKTVKVLLATAIFEPVGYFIFETLGIDGTTTTLAGILAALIPVITVLFETIFLRERTSWLQKLLLLVSIAGVTLVTVCTGNDGDGKNTLWGIGFLVLAYISGALFLVFSRKSSKQFSSVEITFFTTMVGAVVFNSINVTRHLTAGTLLTYFEPLFNTENLIGFLFLSILSSIVATMMNNYALARIQASSVSALSAIGTLTSIALGLWSGDRLAWYHIVGTVLILCGSIGVNYITQKRAEAAKAHA